MEWKYVDKDGSQVMKVWELEGKDVWPQIVLMRVSNATYLKFFQDPKGLMKFVNEKKVFSQPVIIAGPWVTLSSADQQLDPTMWAFTMVHKKESTMYVSALPLLQQKAVSSNKE
jgi:hypothetical protein